MSHRHFHAIGPFPSQRSCLFTSNQNPDPEKRIIGISGRAVEQLGFVEQGTARAHVKVIQLDEV